MLKWIGMLSLGVICALKGPASAAGCPTAGGGCGLNGGWLGENIAFHELDADFNKSVGVKWVDSQGAPRAGTLRIKSFKHASLGRANLVVTKDRLIARRNGGDITELQGWVITVELEEHGPISTFELTITGTDKSVYWTGPECEQRQDGTCRDDAQNIPLYRFTWTKIGGDNKVRSLCGSDVDPDDSGFAGMAVIFTGNHYGDSDFTVKRTSDSPGWSTRFNIACVGTALAKLHFHRHTEAATPPHANIEEQQALLRMLAGDYCGDGSSMTMNGRQLEYTYKQPWYPLYPPFSMDRNDVLDAVWNKDGAVCIDKPRLGYRRSQIQAICRARNNRIIPACTSNPWTLPSSMFLRWPPVLRWVRPFNGYAVALWNINQPNPTGTPPAPSP